MTRVDEDDHQHYDEDHHNNVDDDHHLDVDDHLDDMRVIITIMLMMIIMMTRMMITMMLMICSRFQDHDKGPGHHCDLLELWWFL